MDFSVATDFVSLAAVREATLTLLLLQTRKGGQEKFNSYGLGHIAIDVALDFPPCYFSL